ncbi:hypothetical protein NLI96_g3639 [Meripilus lineatus]|uniref:Uncharacterized protein n=1 Tax=Meripilus lineatus TaxID=2056292 RepID=A0AAD5V6K8_9APHY|nr:hypothetical protein NLI96_g3639 [Physisporinus lineatus]
MLCFLTLNVISQGRSPILESIARRSGLRAFTVFPGGCIAHLPGLVPWLSMTSIPFNSLLFVIRIRAVFHGDILVQAFFFTLWLAVVAGSFTQPFCIAWVQVNAGRGCAPTLSQPYCISSSVIMMAHDTLVLLAISAKLVTHQWMPSSSRSEKFKVFFSGQGLPQVSKLLMQTGQLYYFATVLVNIATIVVVLAPSIPDWYRALSLVPSSAISNFIACRVYREVKLGVMNNGTNDTFMASHPLHQESSSPMVFAVYAASSHHTSA